MKMYIPAIGDLIQLTADWKFNLYNEIRNRTLMEHIGDKRESAWSKFTTLPCTIPIGSVLRIDRIYIRKGQSEFNSVTFFWQGVAVNSKIEEYTDWRGEVQTVKIPRKPVRFWAELDDVNTMEFDLVSK